LDYLIHPYTIIGDKTMKALFLITLSSVILLTQSGFSQKKERSFSAGDWIVQTGVGFIGNGFEGTMKVPPVNVAIEKAISEDIALGAYVGYAKYHNVIVNDAGYDYGYTLIGASLSDHFNADSPDLDLYGRAYLGYTVVSASTFGLGSLNVSAQASFFGYGGYVGATYYLSHGFGLNGELGYGNTALVRVGLSLRF